MKKESYCPPKNDDIIPGICSVQVNERGVRVSGVMFLPLTNPVVSLVSIVLYIKSQSQMRDVLFSASHGCVCEAQPVVVVVSSVTATDVTFVQSYFKFSPLRLETGSQSCLDHHPLARHMRRCLCVLPLPLHLLSSFQDWC